MKAGPCIGGPLDGQSKAILYGKRFIVPKLDGYNKDGFAVFGQIEYEWSEDRKAWIFES